MYWLVLPVPASGSTSLLLERGCHTVLGLPYGVLPASVMLRVSHSPACSGVEPIISCYSEIQYVFLLAEVLFIRAIFRMSIGCPKDFCTENSPGKKEVVR